MALTATRIEKRRLRRGNGLETLVDIVATIGLMLGASAAIGVAVVLSFSAWGVLVSLGTAWGAFLQWLLLTCLAEHLRLQKKIAGQSFEGQISGPGTDIIWACSNCQQMLHSETRCDGCGAAIVPDADGLKV